MPLRVALGPEYWNSADPDKPVAAGPLEPESGLPPSILPIGNIVDAKLAGIDV